MLPHNIKEIFMDACVAVKLRMERGYKLVALLGSNDMSSHFCKNPCVAVNLLYVWSTDECHWDIIADTFNFRFSKEASQLSAISIPAHAYIHSRKTARLLSFHLFRKQNEAGTRSIDRESRLNVASHKIQQTQVFKEFRLCSALASGDNQSVFMLQPIFLLPYFKTFNTKFCKHLPVLKKRTL